MAYKGGLHKWPTLSWEWPYLRWCLRHSAVTLPNRNGVYMPLSWVSSQLFSTSFFGVLQKKGNWHWVDEGAPIPLISSGNLLHKDLSHSCHPGDNIQSPCQTRDKWRVAYMLIFWILRFHLFRVQSAKSSACWHGSSERWAIHHAVLVVYIMGCTNRKDTVGLLVNACATLCCCC